MSSDIYKALKDVSIPKATAVLGEDVEGNTVYQTEGRTYGEGDPIFAKDITPPILKKIENGELDHILEPATEDDFEDYALAPVAPEHELERLAFEEKGRETLTPEEIIEANTYRLDEDREAQEEAKESGADKRNLFLAKKAEEKEDAPSKKGKRPTKAKPTSAGAQTGQVGSEGDQS